MSEQYEQIMPELLEDHWGVCSDGIRKLKAFLFDKELESIDPTDQELIEEVEEYGIDVQWAKDNDLIPKNLGSKNKEAFIKKEVCGVVYVDLPDGITQELKDDGDDYFPALSQETELVLSLREESAAIGGVMLSICTPRRENSMGGDVRYEPETRNPIVETLEYYNFEIVDNRK